MVMSMVRYFHFKKRKNQPTVKIQQADLVIAKKISLTLLYHANMLIADMKDGSKIIQTQAKQQRFFAELPNDFSWAQALEVGKQFGMSPSSVRRYLLGGQFERITKANYRKVFKLVSGEH
jgi:hypothetical protein